MILAWMVYATALATFLGLAAILLEHGLLALRLPTRWIWSVTMLASVIIPIAALLLPNQTSPPIAIGAVFGTTLDVSGPSAVGASGFDVFRVLDPINGLLKMVWFAITGGIFAMFAWTSWRTRRHALVWQPSRVGGVDVVYSASSGPAVIGCFPGTIVLPQWTRRLAADWQTMMVIHEHEHVRARDTALIASGLMTAALVPWNAVVWWQFKRLRHAVELDCDRRVLRRGVNRHAYSQLLIELTEWGQRGLIPTVAFAARKPFLSRRITVMMERTTRGFGFRAGAAIAIAAVLVAIACAMPTPPEAEDGVESSAVASSNAERDAAHRKLQLEEARANVVAAERALADHIAEETASPISQIEQVRRTRLVRAVEEARTVYEAQMRRASEIRHIREGHEPVSNHTPGEKAELHLRAESGPRHKVSPIVFVDGVRQEAAFTATNLDDVLGLTFQRDLTPDQIERIEVFKGARAAQFDGGTRVPVIHITTKVEAERAARRQP